MVCSGRRLALWLASRVFVVGIGSGQAVVSASARGGGTAISSLVQVFAKACRLHGVRLCVASLRGSRCHVSCHFCRQSWRCRQAFREGYGQCWSHSLESVAQAQACLAPSSFGPPSRLPAFVCALVVKAMSLVAQDAGGPASALVVQPNPDEEVSDPPLRHYRVGAPPTLRLYRFGGLQRLENVLTGEVCDLELGANGLTWSLQYCPSGYGYVQMGGTQVWANVLFKQVLYNCDEGIYMQMSTGDGEVITEWLSDIMLRFSSSYASWPPSEEHCGVGKLTIVTLAAPATNGRQHFLNLCDLQAALDFGSAYARNHRWFTKSVPSWERLLADIGLDPSELLRPARGDHIGEVMLQKWHASSAATLAVLTHLASSMKQE